MPWTERAAIFLKAAELLSGPWRDTLNAATMLRSKQKRPPGRDRRGLRTGRLLALQRLLHGAHLSGSAAERAGRLEPHGVPTAGRLRLCRHALQFHLHPGQPAHRPGPHGQHGRVETGHHGRLLGLLPLQAAGRSRSAARCHQHGAGPRPRRGRHGVRLAVPGGPALYRLDRNVPPHVAHHRRKHRPLPGLPAHRRRNRRQGLHRGPRLGRPRSRRHGHRARQLRISGPEVFGRLARLSARYALAAHSRVAARPAPRGENGYGRGLYKLHQRGHRQKSLRQDRRLHRRRPSRTRT